jgi:hypothetical protein
MSSQDIGGHNSQQILPTIQELAGHEEIENTMKYVHLVERKLHLAVRLLSAYQENCHEFTTSELVNIAAKRA